MIFSVEVISKDGELWARSVGDYFAVARIVMDVMNTKKFSDGGWKLTIKATSQDDHDIIGTLDFLGGESA